MMSVRRCVVLALGVSGGAGFSCPAPYKETECVLSAWHTWKQQRGLFQAACNGELVNWDDFSGYSGVEDCGIACFACSYIRACCDTSKPQALFSTSSKDVVPTNRAWQHAVPFVFTAFGLVALFTAGLAVVRHRRHSMAGPLEAHSELMTEASLEAAD